MFWNVEGLWVSFLQGVESKFIDDVDGSSSVDNHVDRGGVDRDLKVVWSCFVPTCWFQNKIEFILATAFTSGGFAINLGNFLFVVFFRRPSILLLTDTSLASTSTDFRKIV